MQLGKMVEHPNQSQPNPGLRADESPCRETHSNRPMQCYLIITSDANWAQRMANHCRYFATEKLQGAEIYDMWLRISAGIGGDPFEYFLCHGEGVFADCLSDVSTY